jgi:hypothetical protein
MSKSSGGMSFEVKAESGNEEQTFEVSKEKQNYIITRYSDSHEHLCHSTINTLPALMNEIQVVFNVRVTAVKHSHSDSFRDYP